MKKLKYVKMFESFINEEYTASMKMIQNLLMINSEIGKTFDLSDEEGKPKREELKKQLVNVQEELKKYLISEFDVKISFVHSGDYGSQGTCFTVHFEIPEGFFTKVKRFFGFGLSSVKIIYQVDNIDKFSYNIVGPQSYSITPEQTIDNQKNCKESVQLQLGSDRQNFGKDADKTLGGAGEIELPEDAALNIVNVIREINPCTVIRNNDQLVKMLNDGSLIDYKNKVEWGKMDANYKYIVANQVVLAD